MFQLLIFTLSFILSSGTKCSDLPYADCVEPNNCKPDAEDWELQPLPISGFVVFELNVPQFKVQRTTEVVIGLFDDIVPVAAFNFAQFAAGGIQATDDVFRYEGTPFHRIEKDLSITGGDVMFKNGSGSITVYNGSISVLPDNFYISNYGKGWVGMVENGESYNHSIGSQFFISLTNDRGILSGLNKQPILHLGKVLAGFELLERINDGVGRTTGAGRIRLDNSEDPVLKVKKLRPMDGDITIRKSSYVSLEQGVAKGWSNYTLNRPTSGCLFGKWQ